MTLRTRLVLVFLLLAVVPLGALVGYSYSSSLAAVRKAAEAEAAELTHEMETRMERIADSLDRRVQSLSDLPPEAWMQPDGPDPESLRRIAVTLGEQAAFVDALEFVPAVAVAPDAPDAPAASSRTFSISMAGEEGRQMLRWSTRVLDEDGEVTSETLTELPVGQLLGQVVAGVANVVAADLPEHVDLSDVDLEITLPAQPAAPGALAAARPTPAPAAVRVPRPGPSERKLSLTEGSMDCAMHHDGQVVGRLKAKIKAKELLWRVLAEIDLEQGELPFALDTEGHLYVAEESHREQLEALVDPETDASGDEVREERDGWIVVTREDPDSGIRFGLARPLEDSFQQVRGTAARNFAWGLVLIGLCFGGILPLSGRMTRNLQSLTEGTERLARGDLDARVPVRSKDEIGRLALHFNHMAEEIEGNQRKLLEQERLRKEEEVERRLLEAENHRKSEELEEARAFQLSLLPKKLPQVPGLELAVGMTTATEVGGDYYDVHHDPSRDERPLTLAVGDATGHGTAAGTMVTVVKSLFIARGGETGPAEFLTEAGCMIRCMDLGRRAMALSLLAFDPMVSNAAAPGYRLTVSSAGMPPLLRHRPDGTVEEIALEGLPLGASSKIEGTYDQRVLDLEPGDTLLVATDGFAELLDGRGEPLGYERARQGFAEAAASAVSSQQVVDHLTATCRSWRGERPLADDVTFLVVRVS